MEVNLQPGWLERDTRRAAIRVAREDVDAAERRIRTLNDELSDACTELKTAKSKLRALEQKVTDADPA